MNKIFKVVWSKAKQCYVVVSEVAKNHSGKKKIVVASVLASLMVGSGAVVSEVGAEKNHPGTGANTSVAWGTDSSAMGTNSVAIGKGATSSGQESLAVGYGTEASGIRSVSVGLNTKATDSDAIAIGYDTSAEARGSFAIGRNAHAHLEYTTVIGYNVKADTNASGATLIGYTSTNKGNQAVGIGSNVTVGENAGGAVAIGYMTTVTGQAGIAIGSNGTNASETRTIAVGNTATASAVGGTAIGTNTNVTGTDSFAAGSSATVSGTSSTAVGHGATASGETSLALGRKAAAAAKNTVAVGTSATSSEENAISIGANSKAQKTGTTAVGANTQATKESDSVFGISSIASGGQSTAIGNSVTTSGNQSFGAGTSTTVSGATSVGIGNGATVSGASSVGIGNGSQATNENTIAVGTTANASNKNATAIGNTATASGIGSLALGKGANSTANDTVAAGTSSSATGVSSAAIGHGASASADNSIALGKSATVAGAGSVALGWNTAVTAADVATAAAANVKPYLLDSSTVDNVNDAGNGIVAIGTRRDGSTGFARRLTGVAGAVSDYDAVNLKQLKALEAKSVQKFLSINGAANRTKANYPDKTWTVGSPAVTAADGSVTTPATTANINVMGNYDNEGARGDNSVALGPWANGIGPRSVALGSNAVANGNQSIALGQSTFGHGENTLAVGSYATVNGENSIAIGTDSYVGQATRGGAGKGISATGNKTTAAIAIGFGAKAYGNASTVLGLAAQSDLAHSVVLGEGSKAVEDDGTNGTSYLTGDAVSNSGNGVVSIGNTTGGKNITRRIINVAGGTNDLDAVNVKQLKALENTSLKTLTINNGGTKTDLTPQARKLTLTAGNNVTLTPNAATGEVTISATGAINAINSGNANTLSVNNNNGTVTITPNTASNLSNTADANKLVTAGTVKSALDQKANASDLAAKANASDVTALRSKVITVEGVANTAKSTADTAKTTAEAAKTAAAEAKSGLTAKIDTTAERHIKEGSYAVQTDGTVTLTKVDGAGTEKPTEAVKITGLATKASVETLTTKVGTVEATANAAKAGLADKADKSTVSDLTTKVGTVEATANAAKAGLEGKLDKASELHVKKGTYTVAADGSVTLTKVDGEGTEKADEAVVINGFATKASVDTLTTEVGKKANASDLEALTTEVGKKANASDVEALTTEVGKKADAATVTAELAKKADAKDLQNLTANKLDKASELHVQKGEYEVAEDGTVTLTKVNGNGEVVSDEAVKIKGLVTRAQIASLGDLSSNGRDGANGTSANKGLTAQDGLNGKTLAEKVNALRNGEAGTLVYTDKDGHRLVKAKDGNYYRVEAVLSDGTLKPELDIPEGIKPEKVEKPELRIVSPDGTTTPAKLSNVDNGTIAENSKDAVNGGQLFASNKNIADIIGTTLDTNGQLVTPTFNVKDKDNKNATTVVQAINLMNDKLDGSKSLADLSDAGKEVITGLVNVTGDNNITVKPSVDEKTKVKTFTAKLNDTITLGKGDDAVAINGTNGTITAGKGDNAVAINGTNGTITAGTGANAVTINGTNGTVIAKNVKANDGVFGAPADAKGVPTAKGNTTTINNNGLSVVSKDAAGNVSTIEIKDGKISGLTPGKGDNDAATVGQVNDAIAQSAGNIGRALEKTSQRVDQVGAHAAALAAMNPLSYDPLRKSQIMAGIGSYGSNQALALGLAHYANENFMFNVGVTMGEGKSMANVGATYRFGTGDDDNIPERYKGGPISSMYVMQDEISALKAENARKDVEYGNKIDMLMERIAMLEAKLK